MTQTQDKEWGEGRGVGREGGGGGVCVCVWRGGGGRRAGGDKNSLWISFSHFLYFKTSNILRFYVTFHEQYLINPNFMNFC